MILIWFSIDEIVERLSICLGGFILPLLIFYLFILFQKDAFMTTYYDENNIEQKFLCKKKFLNYRDIKEIYVVNNYVYFATNVYNFNFKKNFLLKMKVYRILKKEVVIIVDKMNADFLKYVAVYHLEPKVLYDRFGVADVIIDKYFYENK